MRQSSKQLLGFEWAEALARVARARSSPIHMPAALLVLLDLGDSGNIIDGTVQFEWFEERFAALLSVVCPSASETAWEPFFHLSTTSRIWDLLQRDALVSFDDIPARRPKSRSRLVSRADCARVVPDLRKGIATCDDRELIRTAIYSMLDDDQNEESALLASVHKGTRSQRSCQA